MQQFIRTSTILSILLLAGACAHNRGPIVDMRGVNTEQYRSDLAECGEYADQVRVGQKAGAGAVGGAVVGGLIGAAVGNIDTAQRGAGAGAVYGGAHGAVDGVRERHQVVGNCLRNRGYAVLN